MRSILAWMGLGVVCTALAIGLVGQKVLGQPDYPQAPPTVLADELPPAPTPVLPTPKNVTSADPPAPFPAIPTGPDLLPIAPAPSPPGSPPPPGGTRQVTATDNGPLPPPGSLPPLGNFESPPAVPPALLPAPANPGFPAPNKFNEPANWPTNVETPQSGGLAGSGKKEPSVSIEWIGPGGAKLNQPMTCQILVRNTGPVAVQQVVVRHRLPEGVQQRGSEPAAVVEAGVMTWNIGIIEPGVTRRIDLHVVSSVRGPLNCHADVTFTSSSTLEVQVREPLLNVKVKGPEKVVIGEPVTFSITVSNPGDGLTENITVKTTLGEGLDHDNHRVLEVNAGQLAPKETKTLQLVCQAHASGMQQTTFLASADGGLKSTDMVHLEVLQPKLDLVLTGPKLRYIERHAVYALKVTNPSNAPAGNVTLSEVVPAGFTFKAASGSGRYDEGTRTVTWFLGDMTPGQNHEMIVELIAAAAGDHKLIAQVNSARGVKTEVEAQTHVEGVSSLQVEVIDVEDPVEVGAETAYEIRVTNTGTKTESNLQLSCTLPEQMEFRGARNEGDLRFRAEGKEIVFEPLAKLAPKASIVFRVQAKGLQAGNFRFRTQVRADSLSEPIVREEMTRVYSDDAPLR